MEHFKKTLIITILLWHTISLNAQDIDLGNYWNSVANDIPHINLYLGSDTSNCMNYYYGGRTYSFDVYGKYSYKELKYYPSKDTIDNLNFCLNLYVDDIEMLNKHINKIPFKDKVLLANIHFTNQKNYEELPNILNKIPNIEYLHIMYWGEDTISQLNPFVFQNKKIRYFALNGNFKSISNEISNFKNLQYLQIASSCLTELPQGMKNLNHIKYFYLTGDLNVKTEFKKDYLNKISSKNIIYKNREYLNYGKINEVEYWDIYRFERVEREWPYRATINISWRILLEKAGNSSIPNIDNINITPIRCLFVKLSNNVKLPLIKGMAKSFENLYIYPKLIISENERVYSNSTYMLNEFQYEGLQVGNLILSEIGLLTKANCKASFIYVQSKYNFNQKTKSILAKRFNFNEPKVYYNQYSNYWEDNTGKIPNFELINLGFSYEIGTYGSTIDSTFYRDQKSENYQFSGFNFIFRRNNIIPYQEEDSLSISQSFIDSINVFSSPNDKSDYNSLKNFFNGINIDEKSFERKEFKKIKRNFKYKKYKIPSITLSSKYNPKLFKYIYKSYCPKLTTDTLFDFSKIKGLKFVDLNIELKYPIFSSGQSSLDSFQSQLLKTDIEYRIQLNKNSIKLIQNDTLPSNVVFYIYISQLYEFKDIYKFLNNKNIIIHVHGLKENEIINFIEKYNNYSFMKNIRFKQH